jgi:hypothetical protein
MADVSMPAGVLDDVLLAGADPEEAASCPTVGCRRCCFGNAPFEPWLYARAKLSEITLHQRREDPIRG